MVSPIHGHEFEQTLGVGEGQGSFVYYSPWGRKELDTTEQLKNNSYTTVNISSAEQPQVTGGYGIRWCRCRTLPLFQKVLLDSAALDA